MSPTENLATFDDHLTMRFVRVYPHSIERVWDAVSTGEQLEVWMLPASQVERRQGGRCVFSWGAPIESAGAGTVAIFDPPTRVRYEWPDGGYIHFELERLGNDATRLTFIHYTAPGVNLEPNDDNGMDQPAGPDSPWRPGVAGGFHGFLDQLDLFLDGKWTRQEAQRTIDAVYSGRPISVAWDEEPSSRAPANDPDEHAKMIDIYREHIRDHCPPAGA